MLAFGGLDLAFAIALLIPLFLGGKWVMVLSGSMEPTLNVGGLVMVVPAKFDDLKIGDIVVHEPPGQKEIVVAHRAIEKLSGDPPAFRTKGDANEEADQYVVTPAEVVGKVAYHIPKLGYAIDKLRSFSRSALGVIALTGLPGALIFFGEMRNIFALRNPRKVREKALKERASKRKSVFKNRLAY